MARLAAAALLLLVAADAVLGATVHPDAGGTSGFSAKSLAQIRDHRTRREGKRPTARVSHHLRPEGRRADVPHLPRRQRDAAGGAAEEQWGPRERQAWASQLNQQLADIAAQKPAKEAAVDGRWAPDWQAGLSQQQQPQPLQPWQRPQWGAQPQQTGGARLQPRQLPPLLPAQTQLQQAQQQPGTEAGQLTQLQQSTAEPQPRRLPPLLPAQPQRPQQAAAKMPPLLPAETQQRLAQQQQQRQQQQQPGGEAGQIMQQLQQALRPLEPEEAGLVLEELTRYVVEEGAVAGADGKALDSAAVTAVLSSLLSSADPGAAASDSLLSADGFAAEERRQQQQQAEQQRAERQQQQLQQQQQDARKREPEQSVFAAEGVMTEIAERALEGLQARFKEQPKAGEGARPRAGARQPQRSAQLLSGQALWSARQQAVVKAMRESWAVYEQHAWGFDELLPLSKQGRNNWGGMGMMLLDSLDTLYLMGLYAEFDRAVAWVADSLDFSSVKAGVSLFETTIRALGGLLAAHDLSGEAVLLHRAGQLAGLLLPAFHGGALPGNTVVLGSAEQPQWGTAGLAEFGTLGVELHTLAARAGVREVGALAQIPYRTLADHYPDQGLLPTQFNRTSGRALPFGSPELSMAGNQDSYYEYLLKMWLLTQEDLFRDRWVQAMDETLEKLVSRDPRGHATLGKRRGDGFNPHFEHLACFLPGNLALGVITGAVTDARGASYLEAARQLTAGCWLLYNGTATGLSGEGVWTGEGFSLAEPSNQLRPEVMESLWYLWRATGEERYRRWGWEAFQAWALHSRTPEGAFATLADVNAVPARQKDEMATFWSAETLKYLWLLFGDGSEPCADLKQWVYNTEAHPVRVSAAEPPPS